MEEEFVEKFTNVIKADEVLTSTDAASKNVDEDIAKLLKAEWNDGTCYQKKNPKIHQTLVWWEKEDGFKQRKENEAIVGRFPSLK